MVEFDWINIIIPSLIAGGISLLFVIGRKFTQTTEGTLSGTIKLEHVTTGLDNLEDRVNKQFEHVDQRFAKMYEKIDDIHSNVKLNTYRLDKLEFQHRNGNGNKGAV